MGFWDTVKSVGETAANIGSFGTYGLAKDALSQDQVETPDINKDSFQRPGVQGDITQANEQANASRQYARNGVNQADADARITNQAAALGYGAAQANAGAARATGAQFQNSQAAQGNIYGRTATDMQSRANPTINTTNADQARAQQYAALGGVAAQAAQGADTSALRNFYQQGPGPSAAQAQLQGASEANMANSLALSRSGRNGMNPAAERQAMFQNAATAAQTNQQLGVLRAQEEATNRGLNLNAMTAEQQAIAQGRNAQLQALGLQQQTLSGIGQGALNQSVAQANTALAGRGQNDQAALSYDQLAQQARALGLQGGLGYGGLANQNEATGAGYQVGMTNAATGQQQAGNQRYATDTAAGLSYQGMANATSEAERQAQMQYEALKAGQQMAANTANAEYDAQRDAATINAVASLGGLAMKSDIRAKRDIRDLDGIAAQYAALGGPAATAQAGARRGGEVPEQGPAYDLRPAEGYEYSYRDPERHGQGRFVGPMAQDLERSPATRGAVFTDREGQKSVDPGRLTLTNTSAISEQQRELERLKQQVAALGGESGRSAYEASRAASDPYGLDYGITRSDRFGYAGNY